MDVSERPWSTKNAASIGQIFLERQNIPGKMDKMLRTSSAANVFYSHAGGVKISDDVTAKMLGNDWSGE